MKAGRNDPCPCGSGAKYKKCCLAKDEQLRIAASAEVATTTAGAATGDAKRPNAAPAPRAPTNLPVAPPPIRRRSV